MTQKNTAANVAPAPVVGAPAPPEEAPVVQPGQGQVVVTSPTGTKSVVFDYQVDSLKSQGYTV